jgi:hypothetical protein
MQRWQRLLNGGGSLLNWWTVALRHREAEVLNEVESEFSPLWSARSSVDGIARTLTRFFFAFGLSGVKQPPHIRRAMALFAFADFARARRLRSDRENRVAKHVARDSVEIAAWSFLLRDGTEMISSLAASSCAEAGYRYGGAGLPFASLPILVSVTTKRNGTSRLNPAFAVTPMVGLIGGLALRRYEVGKIRDATTQLNAARAELEIKARRAASWDVINQPVTFADARFCALDRVNTVSAFLSNSGSLPKELSYFLRGEGSKRDQLPAGAVTLGLCVSLWVERHNNSTPHLIARILSLPELRNGVGERWLTKKQAEELTRLLSKNARLTGFKATEIVLEEVSYSGYGKQFVIKVNGDELILQSDSSAYSDQVFSQPLSVAAAAGIVWALMDATSVSGAYPKRAVIPGVVAFTFLAAFVERQVSRRGRSAKSSSLAASLLAGTVQIVATLPHARRQPFSSSNRRRTPSSQGLLVFSAMYGFVRSDLDPVTRKGFLAAAGILASAAAAATGRPIRPVEQIWNWLCNVAMSFGCVAFVKTISRLDDRRSSHGREQVANLDNSIYDKFKVIEWKILRSAVVQARGILSGLDLPADLIAIKDAELGAVESLADTYLEEKCVSR